MCEEDQTTLLNSEDSLRLETWAIQKIRPAPLMCEEDQTQLVCEDDQITLFNSEDNLRLETWAFKKNETRSIHA